MQKFHSPLNDDDLCMVNGQVDGNISVLSSTSSLSEGQTHSLSGGQDIPVQIGFRPLVYQD